MTYDKSRTQQKYGLICFHKHIVIYDGISISNEINRINEGTVIDKQYHAAYTMTYSRTVNGKTVTTPRYVPERYVFTIEGEKNGEIVQYTFNVTALEYDRYSIGDYYIK